MFLLHLNYKTRPDAWSAASFKPMEMSTIFTANANMFSYSSQAATYAEVPEIINL